MILPIMVRLRLLTAPTPVTIEHIAFDLLDWRLLALAPGRLRRDGEQQSQALNFLVTILISDSPGPIILFQAP